MQCASSTTSSPAASASRGSCSSRNRGLLSRSGLTSSRSTSSAASAALTCAPLVGVGGVHRHRAQPGALGGRDLVAHQRQQRRHDQRRPAAAGPQQRGGDEVDGGLAPAGALDDQRPRRPPSTSASIASSCPSRNAAESSPTSRRSTLSASARNEGSTSVARSTCGSVSGVVIEATLAAAPDGTPQPVRSARFTAAVRLVTCSLAKMFSRCLRMVASERPSRLAICRLPMPAATYCKISR